MDFVLLLMPSRLEKERTIGTTPDDCVGRFKVQGLCTTTTIYVGRAVEFFHFGTRGLKTRETSSIALKILLVSSL